MVTAVKYSPLRATYGVRSDQYLEDYDDYRHYHGKLNAKLMSLRRRLQLTTRDTRRYSAKEKYSKVGAAEYQRNRLHGLAMLLHAERDIAYAETLKLRARERGWLKKSERRLLTTRLKKAWRTAGKLLEMTADEGRWVVRAELLVYEKLARVEYLVHGKHSRRKDSDRIAQELALSVAALEYLCTEGEVAAETVATINGRFDYMLRQHAQCFSSAELQAFTAKVVNTRKDDPLLVLLLAHGYELPVEGAAAADGGLQTEVKWRSYNAQIHEPNVARLLNEIKTQDATQVSEHDDPVLKWNAAIDAQRQSMERRQEEGVHYEGEDDQILLTYLQFNYLCATMGRDVALLQPLWVEWQEGRRTARFTKYKQLNHVINNIITHAEEAMGLPGVYSDDELTAYLKLVKVFYRAQLVGRGLAPLYQEEGKHQEALALYAGSMQNLRTAMSAMPRDTAFDPFNILDNVSELQKALESSCRSVAALAEYTGNSSRPAQQYELSLLEKMNTNTFIDYANIYTGNLFPLRPRVMPVSAKPTLFDLAFNYIGCESSAVPPEQTSAAVTPAAETEQPRKRGIFGIFR
ncbi:AFL153Wp [Eremothecium gossypii ATCC 10895]|uniref:Signal recognition particle subunit SRP68 n=1 Tax=Eremothecium gossypii (strain ATCC 10895 / CBS 109.51 / FGSC 9923 / NRRL Y-1056) TaxID=284811 RepID=Q755H6_EREGS|nr:AFL153Wp [Eremothecium gossypii ATCC 10895]AAS53221.1 AFL153Wp [Eremothecium gossypii ATCC 10895]